MNRKFVTNLALLLLLNLLIKPFWIFGIDRSVQNTVGAGEYGLYLALFNWALIFNIVLDIGITNFNKELILKNLNEKFGKSSYRKIIETLKNIIL